MSKRTFNGKLLVRFVATFLGSLGAAWAQEEESPVAPVSTLIFGGGYLFDDNQRFGQYNGVREKGGYGLLDLDLLRRDDASGTSLSIVGRNLGLEDRELRIEHARQGNWGYFFEYGQTPRYSPYTVNTALAGIGTGSQTINGLAAPQNVDGLKTQREILKLGLDKIWKGGFDARVRASSEEKTGSRLFGQGDVPGGPVTFFLTDPIDYSTRQLDASLAYSGEQLQLTGGYYGTTFDNNMTALNVAGTFFTPLALPPGNQSHQLYLTGGYDISQTTRGTFSLAYAHATQTETFVVPSSTGRGNLGGRVDTTQAQLGLTARPLPKLTLMADARYSNRDDKTPIVQYNLSLPGATTNGTNEPRSVETTSARIDAAYQLPAGFRLSGGADYEEKYRSTYAIRLVSQREQTVESSYRVELRRTLSDTVSGAVSYVRSEREGSPFLTNVLNVTLSPGSNLIAPLHLSDRTRDKVRLNVNWTPVDPLTLQLYVDEARDSYGSRTAAALGPRSGEARNYSLDASYHFSPSWQATAWVSHNSTRAEQASLSAPDMWAASLRNVSDSFGLAVRGKPLTRISIGADLLRSDITDESQLTAITGPALTSLPDISTRLSTLKVWVKYALQKNYGVRLDYIYDRWSSDDWTWTSWVYSDGTRLIEGPSQKVQFIGLSGYFRWQ